jgi:SAM-dependent methyltransferase
MQTATPMASPRLQELYDTGFFGKIEALSLESARAVVPLALKYVRPRSVIDLGCGTGAWLAVFRENGIEEICGVDGNWVDRKQLLIPEDKFVAADFGSSNPVQGAFDLAISVEVAEHLEPETGDRLVESLTALAPAVMFSAAIPLQGGVHHVNEQWPSYWIERFDKRGFVLLDCLRPLLWNNPNVAGYYAQNLLLFVRRDHLANTPSLRSLYESLGEGLQNVVHPELWRNIHERCGNAEAQAAQLEEYCRSLRNMTPGQVSLKAAVAAIPALLMHALRRRVTK